MKSDIPWKLETQEGINQTLYKNQTRPENPARVTSTSCHDDYPKKILRLKPNFLLPDRLHHYSMVDTTFGLLSPQFVCLKLSKRKFCLLHPFQITNQLFHPALIYTNFFPLFCCNFHFLVKKTIHLVIFCFIRGTKGM